MTSHKQKVKAEATRLVLLFINVPDNAMPPDSNKAWIDQILAKNCAIKCVEEIIKSEPVNPIDEDGYYELAQDRIDDAVIFWEKVKIEAEKPVTYYKNRYFQLIK